jgi:hypothetical protein
MTTIDYKEKYEQAMERARQFFKKPYLEDSAGIVGYIFPELAESKDERIRKRLVEYFEGYYDGFATDRNHVNVHWEGLEVKEVLAWLEKQGKTSPILSNSSNIGKVEQKPAEDRYMEGYLNGINDASKTLKSAGWSEEDKIRLDRICKTLWKNRKGDTDEIFQQEQDVDWLKSLKDRVQPQSQPTWSEEDEEMFDYALDMIEWYSGKNENRVRLVSDWLKSLKQRLEEQQ